MKLKLKVKSSEDGLRIKEVLHRHNLSAMLIHRLKQEFGLILLNEKPVNAITYVKTNDIIEIKVPEKKNEKIELDSTPIDILYEDEYLLIINKPAGISTIPNGKRPHLAGRVLYYLKQKYNFENVFMPINRLDIDTSGIVLIAKSSVVQNAIFNKFRKTYLALVSRKVKKMGTINAPIGQDENNRNKRKISIYGKESKTKYKRLKYNKKNDVSLVKINLLTGRTHQIRVHFSYINHGLIGDVLYSNSSDIIKRTALHSYKVEFWHPFICKKVFIVAPPPNDFINAYNLLCFNKSKTKNYTKLLN